MRELLLRQLEKINELERETNRIIPWLVHHNGKPIKDFRKAWALACGRARVIGKVPHDFRRTAIRNLERAGISRSASMAMVGHHTESIYQRYKVADETMLKGEGSKARGAPRTREERSWLRGEIIRRTDPIAHYPMHSQGSQMFSGRRSWRDHSSYDGPRRLVL